MDGLRTVRGRGQGWRSRWAAVGAAVAVTLGAGGVGLVMASSAPSAFVSVTPERILDTRVDLGLAGPFTSAVGRSLQVTGSVPTATGSSTVVPAGATGVVLNVTAVTPQAAGFISVRPDGTPGAPTTSSLNFDAGDIVPNSVTVALPANGRIEITFDAFGTPGPTTDVLVDVTGYYVDGAAGPPGPQGPPGPAGPAGPAGDVVLSHSPHGLVPNFGSAPEIRHFANGTRVIGGIAHMDVTAPLTMAGEPYGLAALRYCIIDLGSSGALNAVRIHDIGETGSGPSVTLASDTTTRDEPGCYDVEVDAAGSVYVVEFVVSGAGGVRFTKIHATWKPESSLDVTDRAADGPDDDRTDDRSDEITN